MGNGIHSLVGLLERQLSIYDAKPILIKRKATYLLALNYIGIATCLVYIGLYHMMGISEIYFYEILAVLGVIAYLNVNGWLNLAMGVWALIILQSVYDYYPSVPAGYDVGITAELVFAFSLWMFVSYKKWHRLFGFMSILYVTASRYFVNRNALLEGAIDEHMIQMTLNAYVVVIAFLILGIMLDYAVSHEIHLSQKKANEAMRHDAMSRRLCRLVMKEPSDSRKLIGPEYFDEMTGFFNRRAFEKLLPDYYNILAEEKKVVTIAFIDLNGLKSINDKYGHKNGDLYILAFSKAFDRISRVDDMAYRIGGDEFIVVYRDTEAEQVEKILNRLDKAFRDECRVLLNDLSCSFCYGLVDTLEFPELKLEEAVEYADLRMYEMKDRYYGRETLEKVELAKV